MLLCLPGPGQAGLKSCGQLKALHSWRGGQFEGGGWTSVHHCTATLRQMGTVTLSSGLVGSSVCQIPPQRLERSCRTADHRPVGSGRNFWG